MNQDGTRAIVTAHTPDEIDWWQWANDRRWDATEGVLMLSSRYADMVVPAVVAAAYIERLEAEIATMKRARREYLVKPAPDCPACKGGGRIVELEPYRETTCACVLSQVSDTGGHIVIDLNDWQPVKE